MIDFFIILAALCVAAASTYLVMIFKRMEATLTHIEKKITQITDHTIPVLDNLNVITAKVRNITDNIDDQVAIVSDAVQALRRAIDEVVEFKEKVQNKIEEPVMSSVSFISALVRGVLTFFDRMRS